MHRSSPIRRLAPIALLAALALLASACGTKPATAPAVSAPAGQTQVAAPAAAVAPAFDQLVVVPLVVRGSENIPAEDKPLKSCVPTSKFLRNEKISWLIKVMDPKTGEYLDDKVLGSVEIKLADGTVIMPKFGPRPANNPTDHYWAGGWVIPESYPTGVLKYSVTATSKDGRSSTMVQFNSASTMITILEGKVPILPKPTS